MKTVGGERGIRTLGRPLDSETYRDSIAADAIFAMVAASHCTGCTGDLHPLRSAAHEPAGFIGNADKEFQVSVARDTRIPFGGITPNHLQRRPRRDVFG